MEKGKIRKIQKNISEELRTVEESFIKSAEENTEEHISEYLKLEPSYNGSYICADLFKETFKEYVTSLVTRMKYAEIVHNSAAVLSDELFHRIANSGKMKKCIFLSGVPGAGKSFLIQSLYLSGEIDKETMVFEGDITSLSIIEKMDYVKKNNIDIYVVIVNPTVELAQRNAIERHFEVGRGASCETMARIMSKIPFSLENIKKLFPDAELGIYNKSSNYDIKLIYGFENLGCLYQGTYEELLSRLQYFRDVILNEKNDVSEETYAR